SMISELDRLDEELKLAADIQLNMLESNFPPFPDRKEFDLFASMTPAKEVGGDFYDFFLVDEDHLALVIADVSGKGIPAALFMMVSKTLIKNQLMSGCDPAAVWSM
ncbi:MAG: SpoIIE family protein phosphatase, partial [Oscillospiraceae bacterium]|nr:SpoIIE family protein phosphatase [Oscillospiraceae bacterium]